MINAPAIGHPNHLLQVIHVALQLPHILAQGSSAKLLVVGKIFEVMIRRKSKSTIILYKNIGNFTKSTIFLGVITPFIPRGPGISLFCLRLPGRI